MTSPRQAAAPASTIAPSWRAQPVSNRLHRAWFSPIRRTESRVFCPLPILVDSTRRKPLIRWQKRAAVWEHGFESRWGHDTFALCDCPDDRPKRRLPREHLAAPLPVEVGREDEPSLEHRPEHLAPLGDVGTREHLARVHNGLAQYMF
jgi:hypothetical protein